MGVATKPNRTAASTITSIIPNVTVEASASTIHLSKLDARMLDVFPSPTRQLGIVGEYKSNCCLTVTNKQHSITLPVTLPFRSYSLVELSVTDAARLGLDINKIPACFLGRLCEEAPMLVVRNKRNRISIPATILQRHVHTPLLGFDGRTNVVGRTTTFNDVVCVKTPGLTKPVVHLNEDDFASFGYEATCILEVFKRQWRL